MPRWEHRTTSTEIPEGRDGHMVRVIGGWLQSVVVRALRDTAAPGRVIDIGCGEQPLRTLVESEGATYVMHGSHVSRQSRWIVLISKWLYG